ncbi:MAG: DUF1307 domain-containing protein [Lachnospiraceae bacterium]
MRKVFIFVAAYISALMLVGCGGGKEQSVTLTTEQSGATMDMILEAKGDIVQSITQTSKVPLSNYGNVEDEEELAMIIEAAEGQAKTIEESYADIEGVEYSYTIENNEFNEEVKMDVSNSETLEQLTEAGLNPVEGDATKVSLKKTQEGLTEAGWTVVE